MTIYAEILLSIAIVTPIALLLQCVILGSEDSQEENEE